MKTFVPNEISKNVCMKWNKMSNFFFYIAYNIKIISSSVVSDSSVTPRTVAHQAPLSLGFPRQEYWSGLPFPSPGDLPDLGIEPSSPALQADSLSLKHQGSPQNGTHSFPKCSKSCPDIFVTWFPVWQLLFWYANSMCLGGGGAPIFKDPFSSGVPLLSVCLPSISDGLPSLKLQALTRV